MRTSHSLLPDHLDYGLRALFVGINPSPRSAETGHHYAGPHNRFWKVLYASRLIPEAWGYERDADMLQLGFGLTNIVERPTRGVNNLVPKEFAHGRDSLSAKIQQYRPATVVFVGITVFDRFFGAAARRNAIGTKQRTGLQRPDIQGCPVYVVPNPSGRNAHWTPQAMLQAYKALKEWLDERK